MFSLLSKINLIPTIKKVPFKTNSADLKTENENKTSENCNGLNTAESENSHGTANNPRITYNVLLDELLKYPECTMEQFFEYNKKKATKRPPNIFNDKQWNNLRKWRVILGNVKLNTVLPEYKLDTFFLEWEIGNQRTLRVKKEERVVLYQLGNKKYNVKTDMLSNSDGCLKPMSIDFRSCVNYETSYASLEDETVQVRLWRYKKYTLNNLEATSCKNLKDVCNGTIHQDMDLYIPLEGKKTLCRHLSFNLYFQEIYSFKLCFKGWKVYGYQTFRELKYKLMQLRRTKNQCLIDKVGKLNSNQFLNDNRENKTKMSITDYTEKNTEDGLAAIDIDSNLHCLPRIKFNITGNFSSFSRRQLCSTVLKDTVRPYWENIGYIFFTGTINDLDTSVLHVEVSDLRSGSKGAVATSDIFLKGIIDQSRLDIPLYPPLWYSRSLKSLLKDDSQLLTDFGSLEGEICVEGVPQYRQTGEIGFIDEGHGYLFIEIKEVNRIVTAENLQDTFPYIEVCFDGDTRYTRVLKGTSPVIFNDTLIFPIYIPRRYDRILRTLCWSQGLCAVIREEISNPHIGKKNTILINVWSRGDNFDVDCGGTVFSLYQIFFDEKGKKRPFSEVEVVNSKTGERLCNKTRKVEMKSNLTFTFPSENFASITFSAWTVPDLLVYTGIAIEKVKPFSSFPDYLLPYIPELENSFKQECLKLYSTTHYHSRFFYCYCLDQRLVSQFLCSFCAKLIPPQTINNSNAVAHFIHCIHFIPSRKLSVDFSPDDNYTDSHDITQKKEATRIWATPDFTLNARSGSIADHVLLHTSFLLGLSELAFVCIGSLWTGKHHCWVCTLYFHQQGPNSYGYVKFWETSTNASFTLKRRILSRQVFKEINASLHDTRGTKLMVERQPISKKKHARNYIDKFTRKKHYSPQAVLNDLEFVLENEIENEYGQPSTPSPKLPYQSLDILFNHHNIWVNRQDKNPGNIWFDDFWYQFLPQRQNIRPCFFRKGTQAPLDDLLNIEDALDMIKSHCQLCLNNQRSSRNILTRWNDDPDLQRFLVEGLKILHRRDMVPPEEIKAIQKERTDWKKRLRSKVPKSFRLKAFVLHINTTNSKTIGDALVSRCALLDFPSESTFTLAVYLKKLPRGLMSVYVMLIVVQHLPLWERRKILKTLKNATRRSTLSASKSLSHANLVRLSSASKTKHSVGCYAKRNDQSMEMSPKETATTKSSPEQKAESISSVELMEKKDNTLTDSTAVEKNATQKAGEKDILDWHSVEEHNKAGTTCMDIKKKKIRKKTLKIKFPPEAVYAIIQCKAYKTLSTFNDASMFNCVLKDVSRHLGEQLGVSQRQIRAYCCNYTDGYIALRLLPEKDEAMKHEQHNTIDEIFQILEERFSTIMLTAPRLREILGHDAVIKRIDRNEAQKIGEKKPSKSKVTKAISASGPRRKTNLQHSEKITPIDTSDVESLKLLKDGEKDLKKQTGSDSLYKTKELQDFYETMRETYPELYTQYKSYYEQQGYPSDSAAYFAAYYTAMNINQ